MGKILVSWSPVNGQGATTSNIAALAANFSLNYESHSLITNTQLRYSNLELLFGKNITNVRGFEDRGITALERLALSGLLKSSIVKDYTEPIYHNRLDLLSVNQYESTDINPKLWELLMTYSKEVYDLVWIDAHSGTNKDVNDKLLEIADLVLINLPQNRLVLDRFFEDVFPNSLNGKEVIILISQYEEKSTLNIRSIKRKYRIDGPVFPIIYSPEFKESYNQQNFKEMFYLTSKSNKEQSTYEFMQALIKINKYLAKKTDVVDVKENDE